MDVALKGAKIVDVKPHLETVKARQQIAGVSYINGDGKYLIPGLWDAHVHLTYTPGLDHNLFFPLTLSYGVTSLRDTGGHLDQLAEARAEAEKNPLTPDLYVSGPLIDGPNPVYGGQSAANPDISIGVGSPGEAEEAVDRLAAAGVDFIKAYELLPKETFLALAARAERHGLPVAAHVPLSMTALSAAQSGVLDLQHLRNLVMGCSGAIDELHAQRLLMLQESNVSDTAQLRRKIQKLQRASALHRQNAENCDRLITALAENGVYQTPTLTVMRLWTRRLFADEAFRQTYALLPKDIGDGWRERSAKLIDNEPDENVRLFDVWLQTMIKKMSDEGVQVIAGTDAPIGYLTPGASLHEELKLLVDAGLTPLQVLTAATITPARFFGLEDEMGAIERDMKADLVLLSKDPLIDIANTKTIEAVFKNGRLIDQDALHELRHKASTRVSE